MKKHLIVIFFLFLFACDNGSHFAPVVDISDLGTFIEKKSIQKIRVKNFITKRWLWPAEGKIISGFSIRTKGIDIAGHDGTPIFASASGTVVYSGNGLRGYGNLIILKHNKEYLSAYAHNKVLLVKMGAWVKQGQKIAEMGNTGSDKVILHFEIRRKGKPINPLVLLTS